MGTIIILTLWWGVRWVKYLAQGHTLGSGSVWGSQSQSPCPSETLCFLMELWFLLEWKFPEIGIWPPLQIAAWQQISGGLQFPLQKPLPLGKVLQSELHLLKFLGLSPFRWASLESVANLLFWEPIGERPEQTGEGPTSLCNVDYQAF